MGFRQAAVLASISFFAGVIFICMTVDYRILYALDEQAVQDGTVFYSTFFRAPVAIRSMLHGMMGVGVISLLTKLHSWSDSAMYFDGSSLAGFVFCIVTYLTITIPSLRTVVTPLPADTHTDQVQALQLVSAANVINIVIISLIFGLQGGQEYVRRLEVKLLADVAAEEKRATVTPEKKTQ